MTLVSDIIKKVRYILADSLTLEEARGWSDERLVMLVDEAQAEICKEARIFKRDYAVALARGVYTYPLPDDFISIDRVMSWERKIDTATMDDMDRKKLSWRTDEGKAIEYIIQDSVNMNKLEVYPKPDESLTYIPFYRIAEVDGLFYFYMNATHGVFSGTTPVIGVLDPGTGVITSTTGDFSLDNIYEFLLEQTVWGIITDIFGLEGTSVQTMYPDQAHGVLSDVNTFGFAEQAGIWGIITSVSQAYGEMGGTWGAIMSVAKGESIVKIRYSALPDGIESVKDQISIPDKWVNMMNYYVAGYALLDDNDAANNQKGLTFVNKYQADLGKLIALGSSTDASRSATAYRVLGKQNQYGGDDYGTRRNGLY